MVCSQEWKILGLLWLKIAWDGRVRGLIGQAGGSHCAAGQMSMLGLSQGLGGGTLAPWASMPHLHLLLLSSRSLDTCWQVLRERPQVVSTHPMLWVCVCVWGGVRWVAGNDGACSSQATEATLQAPQSQAAPAPAFRLGRIWVVGRGAKAQHSQSQLAEHPIMGRASHQLGKGSV